MKAHRALSAGAVIGALIAVTSACAPQSSSTTITVGAASSLTEVLVTIGEDYMAANPEVTVTFSFAGSSAIAEQIRSGAPLDAFASAGTTSMEPLATEGLVTDVPEDLTGEAKRAVSTCPVGALRLTTHE